MASLLDAILGMSGQERTEALRQLGRDAEYYVPPELRGILGFAAEMTPSETLNRAGAAGREMTAPGRTPMQRVGSAGQMLSETAAVAAPAAVAGRAAMPAAQAVQEAFMGFSVPARAVGEGLLARATQPGPVPTMYSGPAGFDDYLKRVNPRGVRVAAEDRPNLMMGDMYGMLPSGAKRVGKKGDVSFYRGPDGDFYATAFNPDVGEQDVVGYIMPRGDMTELAVVGEMQGEGIGGELQYLFRKENPNAPTGGLTEAGEKALRKTYGRLSSEGLLGDTLPTPRNDAEAMAKQVLEMRAAGRAGDVTEEMMTAADPQYMFYNTPLPMDEASRMARGAEMGFNLEASLYRGDARPDLTEFDTGQFAREGIGVTSSTSPNVAATYMTGDNPAMYSIVSSANNPLSLDATGRNWTGIPADAATNKGLLSEILPPENYLDEENLADFLSGTAVDWGDGTETSMAITNTNDVSRAAQAAGFDEVRFQNIVDRGGAGRFHTGPANDPHTTVMTSNPTNIRSRFARFDPAFAHLRNLSAGVGGLGILSAMQDEQDRENEIRQYLGGLL